MLDGLLRLRRRLQRPDPLAVDFVHSHGDVRDRHTSAVNVVDRRFHVWMDVAAPMLGVEWAGEIPVIARFHDLASIA